MEFYEWLRINLNKHNMLQAQLSRRSGVSEPHISRLLSGTAKAGEEAAIAIAKAFRLSPEEGLRAAGILTKNSKSLRIAEEQAAYKLSLLNDDKLEIANRLLDALLEPEETRTFQKISREVQKPPEIARYDREK